MVFRFVRYRMTEIAEGKVYRRQLEIGVSENGKNFWSKHFSERDVDLCAEKPALAA